MTSGPVTCVYHAYEEGELVATGRTSDVPTLEDDCCDAVTLLLALPAS